jgi:hypothetical protein
MHSFREPSGPSLPDFAIALPMATSLAVGLGTVPLLAALAAGRAVSEQAIALGKASEELFRGDRLPSRPLMTE